MDLAGLLFNPKLAEIEFEVGDQIFPAHLSILFVRCPKLLEIANLDHPSLDLSNLNNYNNNNNSNPNLNLIIDKNIKNDKNNNNNENNNLNDELNNDNKNNNIIIKKEEKKKILKVKIKDISSSIFSQILEYIYTDTLPFDPITAVELRVAADQLGLDRCKSLSANHIKQYISPTNVLSLLQSADLLNENHVKNYCFNFIAKNYDDVANSDQIKCLKHELLIELLRIPTKDFLRTNEVCSFCIYLFFII